MNDKSFTEELKKRLPQCCLRMMSFETGGQETVLFCIAEHSLYGNGKETEMSILEI